MKLTQPLVLSLAALALLGCEPNEPPRATPQQPSASKNTATDGEPGAPLSARAPTDGSSDQDSGLEDVFKEQPEEVAPAKQPEAIPLPDPKSHPFLRLLAASIFEVATHGDYNQARGTSLGKTVVLRAETKTRSIEYSQPWAVHVYFDAMAGKFQDYFPALRFCAKRNIACARKNINTLSMQTLGRRFYRKPGQWDRRTLKRAFAKIDRLEPDQKLLGQPMQILYQTVAPHLREHTMAYVAMLERRKRRQIRLDFRRKMRSTGAAKRIDRKNGRLAMWFYRYGDKHFRDEKGQNSADDPIYGFWMRRIHDGSDRELFDFAMRNLKRFDPDYHRGLAARWESIPSANKR